MSKRDDPIVRANRAHAIVTDPEFVRTFDAIRTEITDEMLRLPLDGANNSHAAMLVQKLQAAQAVKGEFLRIIVSGDRVAKKLDAEENAAPEPFDPKAITQPKGQ